MNNSVYKQSLFLDKIILDLEVYRESITIDTESILDPRIKRGVSDVQREIAKQFESNIRDMKLLLGLDEESFFKSLWENIKKFFSAIFKFLKKIIFFWKDTNDIDEDKKKEIIIKSNEISKNLIPLLIKEDVLLNIKQFYNNSTDLNVSNDEILDGFIELIKNGKTTKDISSSSNSVSLFRKTLGLFRGSPKVKYFEKLVSVSVSTDKKIGMTLVDISSRDDVVIALSSTFHDISSKNKIYNLKENKYYEENSKALLESFISRLKDIDFKTIEKHFDVIEKLIDNTSDVEKDYPEFFKNVFESMEDNEDKNTAIKIMFKSIKDIGLILMSYSKQANEDFKNKDLLLKEIEKIKVEK